MLYRSSTESNWRVPPIPLFESENCITMVTCMYRFSRVTYGYYTAVKNTAALLSPLCLFCSNASVNSTQPLRSASRGGSAVTEKGEMRSDYFWWPFPATHIREEWKAYSDGKVQRIQLNVRVSREQRVGTKTQVWSCNWGIYNKKKRWGNGMR